MATKTAEQNFQVLRVNHREKMTDALENMFFEESLCDVTICCNGQTVKAHRVILAASSSYFKEIFSTIIPGQYPIVFLKSISIEDLNAILEFIYKGEMTVPQGQLDSLVKSAETLGIIGLGRLNLKNQDLLNSLKENELNGGGSNSNSGDTGAATNSTTTATNSTTTNIVNSNNCNANPNNNNANSSSSSSSNSNSKNKQNSSNRNQQQKNSASSTTTTTTTNTGTTATTTTITAAAATTTTTAKTKNSIKELTSDTKQSNDTALSSSSSPANSNTAANLSDVGTRKRGKKRKLLNGSADDNNNNIAQNETSNSTSNSLQTNKNSTATTSGGGGVGGSNVIANSNKNTSPKLSTSVVQTKTTTAESVSKSSNVPTKPTEPLTNGHLSVEKKSTVLNGSQSKMEKPNTTNDTSVNHTNSDSNSIKESKAPIKTCKITKSKLRSWSQQISQKNMAASLSKSVGSITPSVTPAKNANTTVNSNSHINSNTNNISIDPNMLRIKEDLSDEMDSTNILDPSSFRNTTSLVMDGVGTTGGGSALPLSTSTPKTQLTLAPSTNIKIEGRPRGRPRKISLPRFNPIVPGHKQLNNSNNSGVSTICSIVNTVNGTVTLKTNIQHTTDSVNEYLSNSSNSVVDEPNTLDHKPTTASTNTNNIPALLKRNRGRPPVDITTKNDAGGGVDSLLSSSSPPISSSTPSKPQLVHEQQHTSVVKYNHQIQSTSLNHSRLNNQSSSSSSATAASTSVNATVG